MKHLRDVLKDYSLRSRLGSAQTIGFTFEDSPMYKKGIEAGSYTCQGCTSIMTYSHLEDSHLLENEEKIHSFVEERVEEMAKNLRIKAPELKRVKVVHEWEYKKN